MANDEPDPAVVRVIHYSESADTKEEIYLDNKEEVLKVIAEMYDRMAPDDFIEIDNGEYPREKVKA